MASMLNGPSTSAWSVLFLYLLRCIVTSISVCVSIDYSILFRHLVQVQPEIQQGISRGRIRGSRSSLDKSKSSDEESDLQRSFPEVVKSPKTAQTKSAKDLYAGSNGPRDRPQAYHYISPKPTNDVHFQTTLEIYEEIIASDSKTIQVQQETLQSHQDIIRSQASMIEKLMQVLEEQDAQIQGLETTVRALRESALKHELNGEA